MLDKVFILFIWFGQDPAPITVFANEGDCWLEVEEILAEGDTADCRTFHSYTPVGAPFPTAPLTSPRPKPRPEGLK